ncbi:DUF255 [Desulfonema limicola]|uniref:DUF255 n=1 Tax=Desulfonema limicola TaxID=45656 RepID=A0A975BDN8_9BACT|nr:thioredoxin domain-containing protein [Desulfonema limicola]QTA83436.1 DUF255 [Desulfonema limicola]
MDEKYTNQLINESSPYLLQHAHNPVNWYAWGEEAFEAAKRLNRPVLLSVGYSTCHWCHVMAHESFEDQEIAGYMNKHYIAVKVDREERPDIDAVYMSAVTALTGRGGWPMTVWLTPDKKPFYGGTYFPARDREFSPGFLTLLNKINEIYLTQHDKVNEACLNITKAVKQQLEPKPGRNMPGEKLLDSAIDYYTQAFDPVYGGIKGAPKFPSSLPVRFFFRYYRRTGEKDVREMAVKTLRKMAAGGIYDHAGGGFHRYSTDAMWLVPHFEKMLYDNALLVPAYAEAWEITGDDEFRQTAEEILEYITRDMTSDQGGFYSATDADSISPDGHSVEGYYFTWTPGELEYVLGKDRAGIIQEYYGVNNKGNFEGRSILHTKKTLQETARYLNLPEHELQTIILQAKKQLYNARNLRPLPLRDEKILTSWNGLMISGYAKAGMILKNESYIKQAEDAARFILDNMYIDKRLFRSFKDGKPRHNAFLDDYSFFMAALLDLYEASQDIKWLETAAALDNILEEHYEDKEKGGFFMTADFHEKLIARPKPCYDGAEPSGNSAAVLNLLRLGRFTRDERFIKRAQKALKVFLGSSSPSPAALSEMLTALDFYLKE